jgi:hypothetical protein
VRANLAEDVPGQVQFDLAGLGRAPAATRLWQYRVAAEREGPYAHRSTRSGRHPNRSRCTDRPVSTAGPECLPTTTTGKVRLDERKRTDCTLARRAPDDLGANWGDGDRFSLFGALMKWKITPNGSGIRGMSD